MARSKKANRDRAVADFRAKCQNQGLSSSASMDQLMAIRDSIEDCPCVPWLLDRGVVVKRSRGVYGLALDEGVFASAGSSRSASLSPAFAQQLSDVSTPILSASAPAAVVDIALPTSVGDEPHVPSPGQSAPLIIAKNLVPTRFAGYVEWGNFKIIKNIIKRRLFYPIYITGLSGNGKTLGVEQACASLERECIRVPITVETDEDDLLGGFRLVNGETVFHKGPVVEAMERGAILLLDEVDQGANKLMCLQPVLEGNSLFLKKINRRIDPAPGFNIVATANTKGRGDESGKFAFTAIMNEAMLERFAITLEQDYPPEVTEEKILAGVFQLADAVNEITSKLSSDLAKWASVIRRSYAAGACDEVISTRRLVHIAKAFTIFEDKTQAIELCLNRFDRQVREDWTLLFSKIDGGETQNPDASAGSSDMTPPAGPDTGAETIPF